MQEDERSAPQPVSVLIAAAALCVLVLSALYVLTVYHEAGRQEAFLAEHAETGLYLIPVDCGIMPRGEPDYDYLRGTARVRYKRHQSKEVCWYTPSTYDRLFAGRYPETGLAAHKAQAAQTGVDLLTPSSSNLMWIEAGLLIVAVLGVLAFLLQPNGKS